MKVRVIWMLILGLMIVACGNPAISATPTTTGAPKTPVVAAPTAMIGTPSASLLPTVELPAPLYGLAPDAQGIEQLWRLDRDAQTLEQITQEPHHVWVYDISPIDGRLAFVSDNNLIRMDPDGSNRHQLVDGPPANIADRDFAHAVVGWPKWSPDGQTIAFNYGGVSIIAADGGDLQRIAPNETYPNSDPASLTAIKHLQTLIAWSPDSQRIAVGLLLYDGQELPHDQRILIVNLNGAPSLVINKVGTIRWTPDSLALIRVAEAGKLTPAGIWRIDAVTGAEQALVADPKLSVRELLVRPDQTLRAFVFKGELIASPNGIVQTRMTEIQADGTLRTLNQTPYAIQGGLWFPDGSAILIDDFAQMQPLIQIIYADGRPNASLLLPKNIAVFRMPAWGR